MIFRRLTGAYRAAALALFNRLSGQGSSAVVHSVEVFPEDDVAALVHDLDDLSASRAAVHSHEAAPEGVPVAFLGGKRQGRGRAEGAAGGSDLKPFLIGRSGVSDLGGTAVLKFETSAVLV